MKNIGKNAYVFTQEDPRKTPLNQCVSLGDLMATLQKCDKLDKRDKTKKQLLKKLKDQEYPNVNAITPTLRKKLILIGLPRKCFTEGLESIKNWLKETSQSSE